MAFARETAFLAELFQSIAGRSRRIIGRNAGGGREGAEAIARRLISSQGEASGVALAERLLGAYAAMDADARLRWFELLASAFGPDAARLAAAVKAWLADPTPPAAAELHRAAEPLRQELFRRINLAPGGTAALVEMRAALLRLLPDHPEFGPVDGDFVHLFSSWFNRGFLLLRRIDWSSPADVLEKIIRYEAVHEINGFEELRRRVAPPDRRCFGFFHPQMPDDPLIFVEVALTRGAPSSIASLLDGEREILDPEDADTAVFYSISNTQAGLRGVSFGSFLIKQVVDELARDIPNLRTFVTLSPLPGFARWLAAEGLAEGFNDPQWHRDPAARTAAEPFLASAAARYLIEAKDRHGKPLDPVARFHLGNGASLDRINLLADPSPNGLAQSFGVMVNYRYDQGSIEKNHEAYAAAGRIVSSAAIRRLAATRPVRGRSPIADDSTAKATLRP
jgi:malonyl-CoA decarboxylase